MKRRLAILIPVVLVIAGCSAAMGGWLGNDDDTLVASGTLEARNINVGSKVGGRITQVLVAEGDIVQPGQLLVSFDDAELAARVLQARGRYEQAKANYAKMQHGSRPEDIAEARAVAEGARAQEIAQARAEVERAKADAANAEIEFRRNEELWKSGVVSKQVYDAAETRLRVAKSQVSAAEHALAAAEGRLGAAKAAQTRTERGFRAEDIAAAQAEVLAAEGALKEAEARYAEREVRAPAAAVVEVLDSRPGDLLPANATIARLLEANQLYVMVYVPQKQIGHVRVGQSAEVRIDAFPDEAFKAKVEQIRQQAEFLPRNVQTAEEREHQVIGVKLRVENPEGKLRAGINADVKFLAEAK